MSSSPSAAAAAAPWKRLLLSALETNAHLKHARFFQLVTPRIPLTDLGIGRISAHVSLCFILSVISGDGRFQRQACESHRGFQVRHSLLSHSPSFPLPPLLLCQCELLLVLLPQRLLGGLRQDPDQHRLPEQQGPNSRLFLSIAWWRFSDRTRSLIEHSKKIWNSSIYYRCYF